MDEKNLSIVRQSFAQAVFTHQVQEIAACEMRKRVFYIKLLNVIFVALVLILLALQINNSANLVYSYLGAGITIAEVVFLIIQLTFNFENQSLTHKNAALKYMGLRDRYRLLITDIMNSDGRKSDLVARRNSLQDEYQSISDLAPPTGQKEFDAAQISLNKKGIVKGEQYTWSNSEIDHFLPQALKLTKVKRNS